MRGRFAKPGAPFLTAENFPLPQIAETYRHARFTLCALSFHASSARVITSWIKPALRKPDAKARLTQEYGGKPVTVMIEGTAPHFPTKGAVQVYCLAAMVAEEARFAGCDDFAKNIEGALDGLIATLPRADKREALMLSYQMALASAAAEEPARPHLRLVYSRE